MRLADLKPDMEVAIRRSNTSAARGTVVAVGVRHPYGSRPVYVEVRIERGPGLLPTTRHVYPSMILMTWADWEQRRQAETAQRLEKQDEVHAHIHAHLERTEAVLRALREQGVSTPTLYMPDHGSKDMRMQSGKFLSMIEALLGLD